MGKIKQETKKFLILNAMGILLNLVISVIIVPLGWVIENYGPGLTVSLPVLFLIFVMAFSGLQIIVNIVILFIKIIDNF